MSELRRMQQLLAVQTMDTLTNSAHACRCAFADCLTAAPHHQASQPGVHSVQSGCIRPRDVCLGSLNSIGLSLLRSGRSLPRSCMFLAQVGEGMPGSEQNLALRLPRDEVLLIGPLAAKLGRQVDHPAHVALQLTPQQCVCQPLTAQLAKAWNQASKNANPRVFAGHAPRAKFASSHKESGRLDCGNHVLICTGRLSQIETIPAHSKISNPS